MAQKKENLPVKVKVDVDLQNGGTISYANEVIATIAGVAANEVDGVAGMSVTGSIGEILGRNKNITGGVKVEVGSQEASADLYIIVEYGKPIQKVAAEVQENVRKALEGLTGLHVVKVDVHVQGVSFEMDKKASENLLEASKNLAEPAKAQDKEDDAVEDEALSEAASFDAGTLAEEAALDGTEEEAKEAMDEMASPEESPKEPEETDKAKPKRKPKMRLRA